jgi:hypothetical protein
MPESNSLTKSVSDVLALQKETQEALDENGHHPLTKPFLDGLSEIVQQEADRRADGPPTVEDLTGLLPSRIRLSRQLMKSYLDTAENRAKLFKSMVKPIRTLLDHSEITPIAAEHFICLVTDVLLHCDGTEVFDRALLESNIRELSQYVANPEFGDGIEASSKEIPVPTFKENPS